MRSWRIAASRHLISFSNLALMRIRISLAHMIGLFLQHSSVCVCVTDGWGGALSCSKATYFPLHTSLDLFFLEDMRRRYRLWGNSRETRELVACARLKTRLQTTGNRYQLGNSCAHLLASQKWDKIKPLITARL